MATFTPIARGFNNMRGSFKIGPVDAGVHSSLVQRKNGKFVLLDSLAMEPRTRAQVNKLTDGGKNVEAILNLHPFHTTYINTIHEEFPKAKLFGSERHIMKFPDLPWEDQRVDSPGMHEQFAEDIAFSVPKGVDFISPNELVHFSSVLAFHKDSGTAHIDDTFCYTPSPEIAQSIGIKEGVVSLHPTLPLALQKRAGAAQDFREWARKLLEEWDIHNLCTAHTGNLMETDIQGEPIMQRMRKAVELVEPILSAHEIMFGRGK